MVVVKIVEMGRDHKRERIVPSEKGKLRAKGRVREKVKEEEVKILSVSHMEGEVKGMPRLQLKTVSRMS